MGTNENAPRAGALPALTEQRGGPILATSRINWGPQMARERRAKYAMRVAAELTEMHPQTLRKYEREGLLEPTRANGYHRRYSDEDIAKLLALRALAQERGVNVAGLRVLMDVLAIVERMEDVLRQRPQEAPGLRREVSRLRAVLGLSA